MGTCHIALVAACLGAYPGVGACHIALDAACLGAYPGVGAFHSTRHNSYLGTYPGYYGIGIMGKNWGSPSHPIFDSPDVASVS